MSRKTVALIVALVCLLVAAGMLPVLGQLSEQALRELKRRPLEGLGGVCVVVDDIQPLGARRLLDSAALQASAEQRLQAAGIQVLTPAEIAESPGSPCLRVKVYCTSTRDANDKELWACAMRVELKESVKLERRPGMVCTATTWDASGIRMGVSGPEMLAHMVNNVVVTKSVDEFANDYLAANPKE